jgi:hypothetical protein
VLSPTAVLGNYNVTYGTANFTITPATPTVTAVGGTFTYDNTAKAGSGSATGVGGVALTPVNVSYVGTSGTVYGPSATAPVGAGTYSVSATFNADPNYVPTSNSATLTINKADQSITWSNPADIVYGTPLGATQLNATVAGVPGGSAPGALMYSPATGTLLNAGVGQTLTVTAAATANYNQATANVLITVLKANATITLSNLVKAFNGLPQSPSYLTSPAGRPVQLTFNGSTTPPSAVGVYALAATVTDPNYQGSADGLFVIYDPTGGFVTGGGWIDSPAGAYAADLNLSGKANFGFVSKYQKGATVPTGNTEFQFKEGNLNFKSTAFQWLVINGTSQAQFKGTGTINGTGNYNFIVTIIDGDAVNGTKKPDSFRMKITNGSSVVYDNQAGADDLGTIPPPYIQGGSIQIQTK